MDHQQRDRNARNHPRLGERGEGKLAFLVWMAILGLIAMAGWEIVPVRIRMAQYEDFLVNSTERAWRQKEKALKQSMLDKAAQLDLPISKDDLSVKLGDGRIKIDVSYTVPVSLPFYTWEWTKTHEVDRPVYRW